MILDLFAGPGGWDAGLAMLGRRDVLGVEWDAMAAATGRAAGHHRLLADVSELDPRRFNGVSGLVASPPCQGFSLAGKGRGREDSELIVKGVGDLAAGRDPRPWLHEHCADHRSPLVLEPLRYAIALLPDWLAWEQVPAVLSLWQACATVLTNLGYSVWTGVLNAEQYGVPQTRRRAVLMASRHGAVAPPVPTHSRYYSRTPDKVDPGVLLWVSMSDALGWGLSGRPSPTVTGGGTDTGGAEPIAHLSHRYTDRPDWVFIPNAMTNATVRELDQSAPTITAGKDFRERRWVLRGSNQARAAKRPLDAPSPTLHFAERSNKVEFIPVDVAAALQASRLRVSVAEAAALQSFPADYPFQGSQTARYRQVGDAIPPLLAARIVASLTSATVDNSGQHAEQEGLTVTESTEFMLPSQTGGSGGEDDPGYVPGVSYDRYRRYLLPVPGEDPEDLRPWTRVTTLTGSLTSSEGLRIWTEREVMRGLGRRADLRALLACDSESRAVQDEVLRGAKAAAGIDAASTYGRALHRALERVTSGEEIVLPADEQLGSDLALALACLHEAGIRVRAVEQVVVHATLGYAGRLDALWEVTLPDGSVKLRVGDLKTGKVADAAKRQVIGAQLAGYANCTHIYDPATRAFSPPPDIDRTTGYVLHVRDGVAQLYEIDLITGWADMLIAVKLHGRRSASTQMLPVGAPVRSEEQAPGGPAAPAQPPSGTAVETFTTEPSRPLPGQSESDAMAHADASRAEAERSPSGRKRRACSNCRQPGHTAKRCPEPKGGAPTPPPQPDAQPVDGTAAPLVCGHTNGWTRRESDGAWVCPDCGRPSEKFVEKMKEEGAYPFQGKYPLPGPAPEVSTMQPAPEPAAAPSPPPWMNVPQAPTLLDLISRADSKEAIGKLWEARQDEWGEEHIAAARARVEQGIPTAAP